MAKSRIHSVLTALPVLMLMIALWFYYSGEKAQTSGALILQEAQVLEGLFEGLSVVKGAGEGKHYLWLQAPERKRGARIRPEHTPALAELNKGDAVSVSMAPTVSGSKTLWVYKVSSNGKLLLDLTELQ